jgi:hypothetical protein
VLRDEAIEIAGRKAEEQRLPWGDTVVANRIQCWPRPYWQVSAINGGILAGFDSAYTFVVIREDSKDARANLIRPWSDYSMWRLAFWYAAVFAGVILIEAAFQVGAVRLAPNFHAANSVILPIGGIALMSAPILLSIWRRRGKCDWLLRSDVRENASAVPRTDSAQASH